MKNGDVLSYCRDRLSDLGRTEHVDVFNFENIPKPRLSSAFHLALGQSQGLTNNQDNQMANVPINVRLPYAPARLVKDVREAAVVFADSVIASFIDPRNRTKQTNAIRNVTYNTMTLEPLADSNDNGLIINLLFTMLVVASTR